MTNDNLFCSFCNSPFDEKIKLITGAKDTSICTNCLEKAYELVHPTKRTLKTKCSNFKENLDAFKPKKIKSFLDQYVIGQENAKIAISVAVYNHYKRLAAGKNDVEIEKSNILLVGSTGSGKTLLAKTVARLLDVPFCIADATVLTEAGYVGEDVESIISRLLQVADYNVDKTERGIIFIDEIDKIARKSNNPSITRDVSGEGVQQGLLKLLEGSKVKVPPQGGRKHPDQKLIEINTKDILFICGGAFNQIEKIVSNRLKLSTVGFKQQKINTTKDSKILNAITSEDIKTFGLIPELVGRLPVIASLRELSKKDLIRILLEPKNALIKQYEKLLEMDKVKLSFNKAVLEAIAQEAIKNNLGARGLRMIMERLLQNAMYELPESGKKQLKLDINYFKNAI